MTHDELLARIELWKKNVCLIPLKPKWQTEDCKCMTCVSLSALRAVVELHKPTDRYFPNRVWGSDGEIDIGGVTRAVCKCGSSSYPCPTIQAIEKELDQWT